MPTSRSKASPTRTSSPNSSSSDASKSEDSKSDMIAAELEAALHVAFIGARQRRHEFITVEHLLFALLDAPHAKETLLACGADINELESKLSIFIDENTPLVDGKGEVDTQPTLGFQRVIQRAIMYVQSLASSVRRQVKSNDVLVALFGEKNSHSVYYLHQQGITRLDVVNFVSQGIRKNQRGSENNEDAAAEAAGREFFSFFSEAANPFSKTDPKPADRPKLFISYSHVDAACLERLLIHLKPLERTNSIVCWSDKRIRTGDKWKVELESNLGEAVIAILLISADFLASDFIVNNELPPLLVKSDAKGLRILPVILKPCGFRRDPVLSTFQSANDPVTPLLGMSSIEQEALYDKIAEEVAREIGLRRSS